MPGSPLTRRFLVVAGLICSGFVLAVDQEAPRQKSLRQGNEPSYGSQRMTAQERVEHGVRGPGMSPCGAAPRPCARMATAGRAATEGTSVDIPHESVGIGEDDPGAKMAGNYNLHLVFATQGSGQYLADIKIAIEDSSGKIVLETESPGPIFYAKLPPGNYRIRADFRGIPLQKSATVKEHGLRDLYFRWRSEAVAAD